MQLMVSVTVLCPGSRQGRFDDHSLNRNLRTTVAPVNMFHLHLCRSVTYKPCGGEFCSQTFVFPSLETDFHSTRTSIRMLQACLVTVLIGFRIPRIGCNTAQQAARLHLHANNIPGIWAFEEYMGLTNAIQGQKVEGSQRLFAWPDVLERKALVTCCCR